MSDCESLNYVRPTDAENLKSTTDEKIKLIGSVPGLELEFDPEEADLAGAFREDALSAEDAEAAVYD